MKYLDKAGNVHKRLIGAYFSDIRRFCLNKKRSIMSAAEDKNIFRREPPRKIIMSTTYGVSGDNVRIVQNIVQDQIKQHADVLDSIKTDKYLVSDITATALSDIDTDLVGLIENHPDELESRVGNIVTTFLGNLRDKIRNK